MDEYAEFIRSCQTALGVELDLSADRFAEAFEVEWGLNRAEAPEGMDADSWLACKRVYGIAGQVAETALRLVREKGVGDGRLTEGDRLTEEAREVERKHNEIRETLGPYLTHDQRLDLERLLRQPSADDPRSRRAVFENTLQLAARATLGSSWDNVAWRMERLAGLAVRSQNPRCDSYLGRVATCYCLDLRTECAVMCRAVVETALEDVTDDDEVRKALRLSQREPIVLATRIAYLDKMELIDTEIRAAIDRIREGGNSAAHAMPGLEPDLDSLLEDMVEALNAITHLRR